MNDFLSQRVYDWERPDSVRVHQLLFDAFPTARDAARVALAAGLPLAAVSKDVPSGPLWHQLLDAAAAADRLPTLILLAIGALPVADHPELAVTRDELTAIVAEPTKVEPQVEHSAAGPEDDTAGRGGESFDEQSWIASLWPPDEEPVDAEEAVDCERALGIFKAKFCDPSSATRIPVDPEKVFGVQPIIEGKAFRFDLEYDGKRCWAQMYLGLTDFAGRLWAQEANALVRLSANRHVALPEVLDGLVRDRDGIGLVVSVRQGRSLDRAQLRRLRDNPELALRCFGLLADALRELHGQQMVHRAIWREALELIDDDNNAPRAIQLARFEMSAFLASLLDPTTHVDVREVRAIRQYYLRGGTASLLACSPEKLGPLLGVEETSAEVDYRSDIFSLGIVAFEWFIGELPVEAFARELGQTLDLGRFRRAYGILKDSVTDAPDVAEPLKELILRMLRFDSTTRPTAFDIVNDLATHHETIVHVWGRESEQRPFLLSISPQHLTEFLRVPEWQALSPNPDIRFEQLKQRLERDLVGARLLHDPNGAVGRLKGGDPDAQAQSVYVLLGIQAIYFCQPFIRNDQEVDWVLHVNYAVDATDLGVSDIGCNPLQRRVAAVRVVHYRKSGEVDPEVGPRNNPNWRPLLNEVTFQNPDPIWYPGFKAGLDWWVDLQRASLDVRKYPYVQVPSEGRRLVRLQVDLERDETWIEGHGMRHVLARDRRGRPEFGNFFGTLEERGHQTDVTWVEDEKGRPGRGREDGPAPAGEVVNRLNPHEIEVRVLGKAYPPRRGWLRPKDDIASDVLLGRQVKARANVYASPQLLTSLYEPRSFRGSRIPWARAGRELSEEGRGREILKDLLSTFPFYALQGPPGTGKTTIVANAVLEYLRRHPSARILVSAQSHYALDELAGRIHELLGRNGNTGDGGVPSNEAGEGVAGGNRERAGGAGSRGAGRIGANDLAIGEAILVRVVSEKTEIQVRESLRGLGDAQQATERLALIGAAPGQLRRHGGFSEELLKLAAEWKKTAEASLPEIRDHLWRGANVIFATCGTCTETMLGTQSEIDSFDWVIVEEAGKAWPAELISPLVHGRRWTLIGDPNQLPPFGKQDAERVLGRWKRAPAAKWRAKRVEIDGFDAAFDLFGRLFKEAVSVKTQDPEDDVEEAGDPERSRERVFERRRWPVDMLDVQFRMHEHIARVVSEGFYGGKIKTCSALRNIPPQHGLRKPDFLAERAVAWLDTGGVEICRHEERHWSNAGEVAVVKALVGKAEKELFGPSYVDEERIAILSAYHAQNDLLRQRLPSRFRELVHTTDSFQGREADIVIVSLVRTNDEGQGPDLALRRIGHLQDAQRVNVLLSRAKKLLVLIGDFNHFSQTVDTKWPTVCAIVKELGGRVESQAVEKLLGRGGR